MPGARFSARNRPRSSVTSVRVAPVSTFVTWTDAPGSTAFVSSVTVPEMVPVVDCAKTGGAVNAKSSRPSVAVTDSRMIVLPNGPTISHARSVSGFDGATGCEPIAGDPDGRVGDRRAALIQDG